MAYQERASAALAAAPARERPLPDVGISRAYQGELIGLIEDLLGERRLDLACRWSALWLKLSLQGKTPTFADIEREYGSAIHGLAG